MNIVAPKTIANERTRMDKARRLRDAVLLLGLLAFVLAGLASLAWATGWEESVAQLRNLDLWQIVALLLLSLVNYLARAVRWRVFTRALGLNTGALQDARHFLGGLAMAVTPGRVGELIRIRWIRRETGCPFERSAPLIIVDRAADLAAMALILAVAIAFTTAGIAFAVPVAAGALLISFMATRPSILAALATGAYRTTGRFPRLMVRVRQASRSLSAFSTFPVAFGALSIGFVGWAAQGIAFHLLLVWMGADVGMATAAAVFTFATLAGGLTGAPGGVGGAEATMIALLRLQGVPLEVSIPATALIRLTTLWFAIGIGFAVFPLAERASIRQGVAR